MSLNLTIKQKLIALGVLSVAALLFSASMSYRTNLILEKANADMGNSKTISDLNTVLRTKRLQLTLSRYEAYYEYVTSGKVDDSTLNEIKVSREELISSLNKIIELKPVFLPQEMLKEAADDVEKFTTNDLSDAIKHSAKAEQLANILESYAVTRTKLKDAFVKLDKLVDENLNAVDKIADDAIINANVTLAIVLISALAILSALLFMIIISITRPLQKISVEIGRLSEGDYSQDVSGADTADEIGVMAQALNTNIKKIREVVLNIQVAASSVSSASSQISAGSADLANRTEQQASSLEETAASMEEITGAVKQSSQNSEEVSKTSAKARELANKGGEVVKRTVAAMSEIEKSSKKMSEIIGVIDDIAFQTNLLALNAAVEAARAGDAGKGFAVVASEVRSLAGRSAAASKDIKTLIVESSNQVQIGSDLVQEAGSGLDEIVKANNEVNSLISDIANASKEQSTGIDEINAAIAQMDEMTQQNAALVEENTAASQSLVEQASQLDLMMRFFTINNDGEGRNDNGSSKAPVKTPVASVNKPVIKKPLVASAKQAAPAKRAKAAGGNEKYDNEWEEF